MKSPWTVDVEMYRKIAYQTGLYYGCCSMLLEDSIKHGDLELASKIQILRDRAHRRLLSVWRKAEMPDKPPYTEGFDHYGLPADELMRWIGNDIIALEDRR